MRLLLLGHVIMKSVNYNHFPIQNATSISFNDNVRPSMAILYFILIGFKHCHLPSS